MREPYLKSPVGNTFSNSATTYWLVQLLCSIRTFLNENRESVVCYEVRHLAVAAVLAAAAAIGWTRWVGEAVLIFSHHHNTVGRQQLKAMHARSACHACRPLIERRARRAPSPIIKPLHIYVVVLITCTTIVLYIRKAVL